jgi:hypothetical protein
MKHIYLMFTFLTISAPTLAATHCLTDTGAAPSDGTVCTTTAAFSSANFTTAWAAGASGDTFYLADLDNESFTGPLTVTTASEGSVGSGVTFTASSATDRFTATSHGLSDGDAIQLEVSGGLLPAGIGGITTRSFDSQIGSQAGNEIDVFVRDKDTNTFKIARYENGPAIDLTSNGTGTMTYKKITYTIIKGDGSLSALNDQGNGKYTYQTSSSTYASFVGDREVPALATTGGNNFATGNAFISLNSGVDGIKIMNLNLSRYELAVSAQNGTNNHIYIKNVDGIHNREVFRFHGDATCTTGYRCATGSRGLIIDGCDWDYVSKRGVRLDLGIHNFTVANSYFNGQFINGDEIAMGFQTGGTTSPIYNGWFINCTFEKFAMPRGTTYDNGDGGATETLTSNMNFDGCKFFDTQDGALDLKGGPHSVINSISMRDGQRPWRNWHGKVYYYNVLGGWVKEGDLTQYSDGSPAVFWVGGSVDIEFSTMVNSAYPYRFDNETIKSLTYTGGTGSVPIIGSVITGGTSGVTAKIADFTGNASSGTLYIFNGGTFTNPETITGTYFSTGTSDGFSATTSSNGTAGEPGKAIVDDSIIALDKNHTSYSTSAIEECGGCSYTLTETNVAKYVEGVSGTSPQFGNIYNKYWRGENNDYDSALYTNTKGYYRNGAVDNSQQITIETEIA